MGISATIERITRRWRAPVYSWHGWPVRKVALVRSPEKMRELVATARESGFSRTANGIDLETAVTFAIFPYLPESSPVESWICLVASFNHPVESMGGKRPQVGYSRLDIASSDFENLPMARRKVRDQLLHWMVMEASRSRRSVDG